MHVYIPSLSHICIHIRIYKYIHISSDPVIHLSYISALSWSASPAFKNGKLWRLNLNGIPVDLAAKGQSQHLNQWDHHPSASAGRGDLMRFFRTKIAMITQPSWNTWNTWNTWNMEIGRFRKGIWLIIYNWKLGMSSIVVIYLHNANVKIWDQNAQEEHDSGLLLYVSHCNVI